MSKNTQFVISAILLYCYALQGFAGSESDHGQGWDNETREEFYHLSQGSRIMPYDWFLSLEMEGSKELFTSNYLSRYGYLPSKYSKLNKDKLPVGFALDKNKKGYWIGFTCAACHVEEISFNKKLIRIDGGPSNADFLSLIIDLEKSVSTTLKNKEKLNRFFKRVNSRTRQENRISLHLLESALKKFSKEWSEFTKASTPNNTWGPGRNDALNMIFNRIAAINLKEPENSMLPEAPVSYPHIWGASYHNKVQWNGSVDNTNAFHALARNAGEVLGVFGEIDLTKKKKTRLFYDNSINRYNLFKLEKSIKKLYSPRWPGSINTASAKKGKKLFYDKCETCHKVLTRKKQHKKIKIEMTPIMDVGTDPEMALMFCNRKMKTGKLEGSKLLFQDPLPSEMKISDFLRHVVAGALLRIGSPKKSTSDHEEYLNAQKNNFDCGQDSPLMAYKARPLEGIWATPPYLHNGSVKNLYQLLLPSEKRDETFTINSREFDTKHVGFKGGDEVGFTFDTKIKGNSNKGHDTYGNDTFSDDDRWALIEYLKTL